MSHASTASVIRRILYFIFIEQILGLSSICLHAQTRLETTPLGYIRHTLAGNATTTIAIPLQDRAEIAGRSHGVITSVGASTIEDINGGWLPGELSNVSAPYYLRITSGAAAGHLFYISPLVSNTSTQLTINGVTDLAAFGIVPYQDTYEIFPADTLSSLFPTGTLQSGDLSTADLVYYFNGAIWIVYYHDGAQWRRQGAGGANNALLWPTNGLRIVRRGSSCDLIFTGRVPRPCTVSVFDGPSLQFLTGLPVQLTLCQLAFQKNPNWKTGTLENADYLRIWDGNDWITYYHDGIEWRTGGGPANDFILYPGVPFMMIKRSSGRMVFTQKYPDYLQLN